jgi:hypothetical protein
MSYISKKRQGLSNEARQLADLADANLEAFDNLDDDYFEDKLKTVVRQLVIAEVVGQYTLIDEVLSEIVARYFFVNKDVHFGKLWRRKKFQIFSHHILDEIYLLKKMAIVDAIKPLPGSVKSSIHRINSIRNAIAHSFFPENRREFRKQKGVLFRGKDIYRPVGLSTFKADAEEI